MDDATGVLAFRRCAQRSTLPHWLATKDLIEDRAGIDRAPLAGYRNGWISRLRRDNGKIASEKPIEHITKLVAAARAEEPKGYEFGFLQTAVFRQRRAN